MEKKLIDLVRRRYHLWGLRSELKQRHSFREISQISPSRNEQYLFCLYYFEHFLPDAIREQRRYFSQNQRGFGEDAFHAMWFLLFQEFRPARALEIGVYRGQIITLWKLLSRYLNFACEIGCVSPFTAVGDSVSHYHQQVDYLKDVEEHHRHFGLPMPAVCRHYSTDAEAKVFIKQQLWDVIYIDGNHDYEVVLKDWSLCSQAVAPGGLIVLDDSALFTDYRPLPFATAGHPGPSQLTKEIDPGKFREIFSSGHNRVFQRIS